MQPPRLEHSHVVLPRACLPERQRTCLFLSYAPRGRGELACAAANGELRAVAERGGGCNCSLVRRTQPIASPPALRHHIAADRRILGSRAELSLEAIATRLHSVLA